MKKVLNVLGIIGSIFLTIILTTLLICFVFLINTKSVISERGIVNSLKNINVVETIKSIDDGVLWENFEQLSDELNITEEQFESILNSNAIKEEFGEMVSNILNSLTSEEPYTINKSEFIRMIDLAIDEYNKVADEKITKEIRDEVITEINDEFIDDLNESLEEINIESTIDDESKEILKIFNYILFGSFSTTLLILIIIVIGLIALFRFSPIKWMPYVGVSSLTTSVITLITGLLITFIPINDIEGMEVLTPLKNMLSTNIYISAFILFIIYIGLTIIYRILKKKNIEESIIQNEQIEN